MIGNASLYKNLKKYAARIISNGKLMTLGLLLLTAGTLCAQSLHVPGTIENEDSNSSKREHKINFGIKGGFTSSLFLVSNLSINGISIDEVQNNYKIGYFGSMFMRINFGKHFLQPEVSYNINRCNITFFEPGETENTSEPASITSSIHSIDIPILYGYNVIKDGDYSMAIFGGPKLRYIWNKESEVTFKNFSINNLHERLYPLNASFTIGTSVTISRVFFDFRYDIGLHNISREVTESNNDGSDATSTTPGSSNELRFHRQDNVLSFSLGLFF